MRILKLLSVSLFAACLLLPINAAAQNLQNSQSSLQRETGQTQNTGQLQNQTAPLQTNNPGQLLSQDQPRTLNVVSSPSQTSPDASVEASDTNNAPGTNPNEGSNLWVRLMALSIVGFIISLYAYYRSGRSNPVQPTASPVAAAKSETTATTVPAKKKKAPKKSSAKKKKKKAHHH